MLTVGSVLDKKYEILREIGKGASSKVYLAMNSSLNQQWVIKEISHSIGQKKMEQVEREAQLMMELDHPAIPRIVDILRYTDVTYIIMDYISGQTLHKVMKGNGKEPMPQPQSVVLEWAKQIVDVMEYLHTRDTPIIYHDLKPGNLILKQPENNVKLIDFGEARKLVNGDAHGGGFTHEYASPEQQKNLSPIQKKDGTIKYRRYKDPLIGLHGFGHENIVQNKSDQRSDIYCVGTTLYRLLTGKLPPELPEPVGSIRERFPELDITSGMDNIIAKCTQINPDKRFQSMTELKEALMHIETWDRDHLQKLFGRLRTFAAAFFLSIALLVSGVVCNRMSARINQKNYDVLIDTEPGMAYQTRIDNYEKAIEINGSDPRAYHKLLEAYRETDDFDENESQQFVLLYNKNKSQFDMSKQEILDLNYEIGKQYFLFYSGDGNSLRSRIQKAKTYFEYVHENAEEDYYYYGISESYYTLCSFFSQYVLNTQGSLEPSAEECQSILDVIEPCLSDMNTYQGNDASMIRLSMYQELLSMLNSNIRGFVQSGIKQSVIETAIQSICSSSDKEADSQEKNRAAKEQLQLQANKVLDEVKLQYSIAGRMK